MAWKRAQDAAFYADASRLQHHAGDRWLVLWGPGSRRFWAFQRAAPNALILSDPTASGLYQQIQRNDLRPRP